MRAIILTLLFSCLLPVSTSLANTSHEGWPAIDGVLLMNKDDSARPLDARPGQDPFGGQDQNYSCDSLHVRGACQDRFEEASQGQVMTASPGHNELLGGHGRDTIYAGPSGDVLWGDYKPSGQPTTQRDTMFGGAGRDFIYASHGFNAINAGAGNDWIKAHFGSGTIDCGPGSDLLYVSRRAQRSYRITGCERISHKTLGY
jgi:Ca2+-binding RTX toxin-like protein